MFDRRLIAVAGAAAALLVQSAPPAAADSLRDAQWHLGALDVAAAQRTARGQGITVAVIDSGVSVHADLEGNVLPGFDVSPGGGDGRQDGDGHGTKMAALIAAHGHGPGGTAGALGIAPEARILPIRDVVDPPSGPGSEDAEVEADEAKLASGIRWAVDHGAKIISISQLWPTGAIEVGKAVDEARKRGVLIFAAAGNTTQGDREVIVPASLNWVVAVGATTPAGGHWSGGVTGTEVELAAPGEKVVSVGARGEGRQGSGSSDSTAIAAGVAALVWSAHPEMSAREVLYRMEATATDAGAPGRDPEFGFGVVNPVAALTAKLDPLPAATAGGTAPATTTTTARTTATTKAGESAAPVSTGGGGGVPSSAVLLMCGGLLAALGAAALYLRGQPVAPAGAPPVAGGMPGGGWPPPPPPGAPAPRPPASGSHRRAFTILAVAAVAVVAGGALVLVRSGDDPHTDVTGGDGGGGGRHLPLPRTPHAAIDQFVAAQKANDCERSLELETKQSWSRYESVGRGRALANCRADVAAFFTGTTVNPAEMLNLTAKDGTASVDVIDANGKTYTLIIGLAKVSGGWQINAFKDINDKSAGYVFVIDRDRPPAGTGTTPGSGPVIDTGIHIPAENKTPESCLSARTAAQFGQCYDDEAAHMFTT